MTGTPLDWGIGIGIAVLVLRALLEMVGKGADRNHKLLERSTLFSREDYLRLESGMHEMRSELKKTIIGNAQLQEALRSYARRDIEFYDRQLPALMKRAVYRDFRIDNLRDSINDVRAHLDMPLTMTTPPQGVPVLPPPIPTPIKD